MYDLNTMFEVGEGFLANQNPQTLIGFVVALTFLVLFRGVAWCLTGKRSASSLGTALVNKMDTCDPSKLTRRGDGKFQYGNIVFNANGVESVGKEQVDGHLTRKERKLIKRKIAGVLVRRNEYENQVMASAVTGVVANTPSVDRLATIENVLRNLVSQQNSVNVPVASPAEESYTDADVLADVFATGKDWRTVEGLVKETGLDANRVQRVVNGKGYKSERRKSGKVYYSQV